MDIFKESGNGFNDFNMNKIKREVVFSDVNRIYLDNPKNSMPIDSIAFNEMKEIVNSLRMRNIRVYAYFYPIYKEWFDIYNANGEWDEYKSRMMSLFVNGENMVWDMNDEKYDYITRSMGSYTDGHLSYKGAGQVLEVIDVILNFHH